MNNEAFKNFEDIKWKFMKVSFRKEFLDNSNKQTTLSIFEENGDLNEKAVYYAVCKAWSDMYPINIDNIRSITNDPNDPNKKETCIKSIVELFEKYFTTSPAPEDSKGFEKRHKDLCHDFKNILYNKYGVECKYGRAQKIINMTFKYLYCYKDADEIDEKYFKFCHMPLDMYTLSWYYKISDIRIIGWSYINENLYYAIQEQIRSYVNHNSKYTVLQAEFIIWFNEKNNYFELKNATAEDICNNIKDLIIKH